MSSKRRRLVCHHEAGHALARWYFGHSTDIAAVLSQAEWQAGKRLINRDGNPTECEGLVSGYNISDPMQAMVYAALTAARVPEDVAAVEAESLVAQQQKHMRCDRDVALIVLSAGICAEAAYLHRSPGACGLEGGSVDFGHLGTVGEAWFPDEAERDEAFLKADVRATALVRSRCGAAAIRAMADALMEHGELDGDAIDRLCRAAYGDRASRPGSWAPHWPPGLRAIRAGWLPGSEPDARPDGTGGAPAV